MDDPRPLRQATRWRVERAFPGITPSILAGYRYVYPLVAARSDECCVTVLDEKGMTYGLDAVSSFVWMLCDGEHALTDIAQALDGVYGIGYEVALSDCGMAIDFLKNSALLVQEHSLRRPVTAAMGAGISSSRPADSFPVRAPAKTTWDITWACNHRCRYCYASAMPEAEVCTLSTDQCKGIADSLWRAGVYEVSIGGGEALLRPDFWEIVRHIDSRGLIWCLLSNGSDITPGVAAGLRDHHVDYVQLTIDASVPSLHDHIHQCAGAHERVLGAARHLRDEGVPLFTTMTLNQLNATEVVPTVELSAALGARVVTLRRFAPVGRGSSYGAVLGLTPAVLAEVLLEVTRNREAWNNLVRVDTNELLLRFALGNPAQDSGLDQAHTGCRAGRSASHVLPDGTVYPCNYLHLPVGNLTEETLTDIWDSPAVAEVRSATGAVPPSCRECHLVPLCVDRCPGHAHAQYGSFQRRDPLCYRQVDELVPDIVRECVALARQKVGSWKQALPTPL